MPLNIVADSTPIPGYRLVGLLGAGGYGQVWEAEAPGGLRVAIKFIRMDTGQADPELRALETFRNVRHPHLLDLHFALKVENYLVIGTSLCDKNLFDRLVECRDQGLTGIPTEELWRYMDESATAIDFLNETRHEDESGKIVSIQHRDIKPLNLFLVGDSIKVADFGLAKVFEKRASKETDAMSPHYTAPERMDGHIASSSDQYSLAVSYCELRSGTLPFDGSLYEIIDGHVNHEPDLSALPDREQLVVRKALSKIPDDRWESCREFVLQLKQPLQSNLDTGSVQHISSETHSGWDSIRKPPSKVKAQTPHLSQIDNDENQAIVKRKRPSRLRRKRKRSALPPFLFFVLLLLILGTGGFAYFATGEGAANITLVEPPAGVQLIKLDGQEMSVGELQQLEHLPSGSHHLEITGTGFEVVNQKFSIWRGRNLKLQIEFVSSGTLATTTPDSKLRFPPPDLITERPKTEVTEPVVPRPDESKMEPVLEGVKFAVVSLTVIPSTAEVTVFENALQSGTDQEDVIHVERQGAKRLITVPVMRSDAKQKLTVVAKLDGFEPLERSFTVAAKQTNSFEMKLIPQPAVYEIQVTPAGAEVKSEGLMSQIENSGKSVQLKVLQPDGKTPVVFTATFEGYEPAKLQFVPQPGATGKRELKLKAMLAILQLNMTPANATLKYASSRVRLVGEGAKRTLTVADSDQLQDIEIHASLTGYVASEFSWSIKPGEKLSHTFDLLPKPSILNVTVQPVSTKLMTTPANVKISEDGATRQLVLERPDRTKAIKVYATTEGYESLEFEWLPKLGQETQKNLSLIPKPVTLTLTLNPANADVRITPEATQKSGKGSTKTFTSAPLSGPYKIEAFLKGYESQVLNWKPEINVMKEHRFNLVPVKPQKPSSLVIPFDARTAKQAQEQSAAYAQTKVNLRNSIGVNFVLIPPGQFTIGLPADASRRANAIPAQEVEVKTSFHLSTTEVTQKQWLQVMGSKPWSDVSLSTGEEYPAAQISWNDAHEFCRKLSEMESSGESNQRAVRYRLPTEKEWEWACRAGSNGSYCSPDSEIDQHAWYSSTTGDGNIHPVASLKANHFGLYDTHGNVSEWCSDIFVSEKNKPATSTPSPEKGILRGGSWSRTRTHLQSTARDSFSRDKGFASSGFRIVKIQ